MDSQKQQAAERIKQANNILVTVSSNPSVDQLAACIGVTLALNKAGKHGTAVFSGDVPSTIEFLQPEKTLERNTDSLRDFIIALDKSKADKLRYKVEDKVVKIFITPYKTSISEKDLEFSQGDFNVDVVLALGVHSQAELDQAITAHGRILHDATVITLNTKPGGELGSINWLDPNASSLSELGTELINLLDKKLIDGQIATAFLTGIVAETERFSNARTTPQTMSISAELMAAGANQQLVATKLEEPATPPPAPSAPIATQESKTEAAEGEEPPKKDDGTLEITHEEEKKAAGPEQETEATPEPEQPAEPETPAPMPVLPEPEQPAPTPALVELPPVMPPAPEVPEAVVPPQIHIDEHGNLGAPAPAEEDILPPLPPKEPPTIIHHNDHLKMIEPPTPEESVVPAAGEPKLDLPPMSAAMSAPQSGEATNPLDEEMPSGGASPADSYLVGQSKEPAAAASPAGMPNIPVITPDQSPAPAPGDQTLSDIEKELGSSHAAPAADVSMPAATLPAPTEPAASPALASVPEPMPSVAFQPPDPVTGELPLSDQSGTSAPASAAAEPEVPDVNSARDAVAAAINSSPAAALEPIQALNAQPVDLPSLGGTAPQASMTPGIPDAAIVSGGDNPLGGPALAQPWSMPTPTDSTSAVPDMPVNNNPGVAPEDPNAPPPVPPPMMPPMNPY